MPRPRTHLSQRRHDYLRQASNGTRSGAVFELVFLRTCLKALSRCSPRPTSRRSFCLRPFSESARWPRRCKRGCNQVASPPVCSLGIQRLSLKLSRARSSPDLREIFLKCLITWSPAHDRLLAFSLPERFGYDGVTKSGNFFT